MGAERYKVACQAVSVGNIKDVEIAESTSKTDKVINKDPFYQALVDSLTCRLMPESEKLLTKCVNVMLPSTWPAILPP